LLATLEGTRNICSSPSIEDYLIQVMPHERRIGTIPMEARDRGNWIDTEGAISAYFLKSGPSTGSFRCSIHVVKNERAPLDGYAAGAIHDGVPCLVYFNSASHATHAYIQGIRNVDREIRLTCASIRTANKWRQIRRFYELVGATEHRRDILAGHQTSNDTCSGARRCLRNL